MKTFQRSLSKLHFRWTSSLRRKSFERLPDQMRRISVLEKNGVTVFIREDFLKSLLDKLGRYPLTKETPDKLRVLERYCSELNLNAYLLSIAIDTGLRIAERRTRRIAMAPGRYLGWFARTFFTFKTQERVIEPLIADYQHEVFEAIVKGDAFRERFLPVLYGFKFLWIAIGKGVEIIIRLLQLLR
jgi:hypothetical protein